MTPTYTYPRVCGACRNTGMIDQNNDPEREPRFVPCMYRDESWHPFPTGEPIPSFAPKDPTP